MPADSAASPNPRQPAGRPGDGPRPPVWPRLRRHPLFPILVFIALSLVVRENYPISHFPMYSRPSPEPMSYYYLADENGEPLPILWHTGVTISQLTKKLGHAKARYEGYPGRNDDEVIALAAADVLDYLRKRNAQRERRPLPETIRMVRAQIRLKGASFIERISVAAVDP